MNVKDWKNNFREMTEEELRMDYFAINNLSTLIKDEFVGLRSLNYMITDVLKERGIEI